MANENLEKARSAYETNLREPFQNLKAMGLMPQTGPLPEPESPQVPLAAAELIGFEQNFAPAVRERRFQRFGHRETVHEHRKSRFTDSIHAWSGPNTG
jgi:hypothetical protein